MSLRERGTDTRVNICVPLQFRALNNPGSTEQTALSENLSQRGMYFLTNVPLKIGTPVELSLRMSQELAGRVASDVKWVARVVHVRPSAAPGGVSGTGLHIERYDAKASARERWASSALQQDGAV
ncbi:MAG TPA: PilZ domain-containing protein [Candidatus Acidoferrales bacterium]|nr:PilZ domain-containing protein [Candidatus Acidoferrales bacterium]